jgi:hypothetical protein
MISTLKKLGIEAHAIEQPLDLSVPENRMTLAIYLAVPEVENARRALNIKQGMRRAKKEGKWVGLAPIGYENKITESGVKYISPTEPKASLMREAFELLSTGQYNINQVYEHTVKNGLRSGKNAFHRAIRNPVYCGKIFLPADEKEEARYINGLHEPLISESLFVQVQRNFKRRKGKTPGKIVANDNLPFRGFLKCPACGKTLTGSGSKSKTGRYYYYYHCSGKCRTRNKAELIEKSFIKEIKKYVPGNDYLLFFRSILKKAFLEKIQLKVTNQEIITSRINDLINKILKAEELMLLGEINSSDYNRIKEDSELQINILGEKLSFIKKYTGSTDKYTRQMTDLLARLPALYDEVNTFSKRQIIGLLFPDKLTFEIDNFRPAELTDAARIIYHRDFAFSSKP